MRAIARALAFARLCLDAIRDFSAVIGVAGTAMRSVDDSHVLSVLRLRAALRRLWPPRRAPPSETR
jgi:hypothetical protein